jgi:signal transduction histidine kinase
MLDRLETAFEVQKDFISNASHELRTPLTAITGQLDVLLMKDRSTKEYRDATVAVLEDIKNLNKLIDRLLLMAHASSESAKAGFRGVRIDEILWQSRDELMKYDKGYSVNISLDDSISDLENMIVLGDDQLLRSAVTNIMDNGCKYSPDKSVDVALSFTKTGLSIKLKDRGTGISDADIQRIFEPFYRGTVAGSVRGHGIGLSLAKKIIEIHQGQISVVSQQGIGTEITIFLPPAQ